MSKKSVTLPGTPLEIASREKARTNNTMRVAQRGLSAAQAALKEAQEAVDAAQAAVTESQVKFLVASAEFSKLRTAGSSKQKAKPQRTAAKAPGAAEPDSWTVPVVMNGRPVVLKCRSKLNP